MTDELAREALSESSPPKEVAASTDDGKGHPSAGRTEIRLRLFGKTDVGQVREHNEDNFIVADLTKGTRNVIESDRTPVLGERGALLGVCDGMGGAAAGEVASQLAVDIIFQKMTSGEPPKNHDAFAARLVHSIEAAGLRIFSEAKMDRTRRGMGTTSTIAALIDDHLFVGQVGDSRAYILRGERLVQITRDQSLVNQLIEAGQLTEEEAETFEHNNIILQALGTADTVQVDLTFVPLRSGDTLMLCSDGLSGMIRNDEIREVLRSTDEPVEACKLLTERANQAGGHDNITVVVAKFEGAGLKAPTPSDIEGLRYAKYELPETIVTDSIPSPNRRVKDLDEAKISVRSFNPSTIVPSGTLPDIELPKDGSKANGAASDDAKGDEDHDEAQKPRFSKAIMEDPIDIPTEGAPTWLVIMMIASAVACVTIAVWYLVVVH
ncbi:MAG TPA: Stp1/IreP family PP2C-type Ser/Thr phosphatase [Polyangiaceae bacterium]|jgi:protein phosphatase|nr:Stp1/IreP family PP2C-type Ser/Thr phosphatase [Polyangiaceae bacterium]